VAHKPAARTRTFFVRLPCEDQEFELICGAAGVVNGHIGQAGFRHLDVPGLRAKTPRTPQPAHRDGRVADTADAGKQRGMSPTRTGCLNTNSLTATVAIRLRRRAGGAEPARSTCAITQPPKNVAVGAAVSRHGMTAAPSGVGRLAATRVSRGSMACRAATCSMRWWTSVSAGP
jgi:hypothetical protein